MRAPEITVAGKATARLTFDAWPEGKVIPTTVELNVVAGKSNRTLETVSARLKRELIHPDQDNFLNHLQFSPDGKQLIGCTDPGGIIQVWDAQTGQRQAKVDVGLSDERPSYALLLSTDGQTVYFADNTSQFEILGREGPKTKLRWTYTGGIKAWDVATGQTRAVYQHEPPRGTLFLRLSPDGRKLLALERLPGVFTGGPDQVASLWDVRSKQAVELPAATGWGVFSPDSKTIAYADFDKDRATRAIKVIDIATRQKKLSIPTPGAPEVTLIDFSPDGKMLLGSVRDYPQTRRVEHWEVTLKLWDVATGQELLTVPGPPRSNFGWRNFSADGRLFAVALSSFSDPVGRLVLVDLEKKQLRKTVLLDSPRTVSQRVSVAFPAFSPDGRWLAVVTRVVPEKRVPGLQPEDVPQPRIHLIDTTNGEIRETFIAPPGMPSLLSFSPDGKTLATGDRGKVLLWDMTQPPGSVTSNK